MPFNQVTASGAGILLPHQREATASKGYSGENRGVHIWGEKNKKEGVIVVI